MADKTLDKPIDITYGMGISEHPIIWSIAGVAFVLLVVWFIAVGV